MTLAEAYGWIANPKTKYDLRVELRLNGSVQDAFLEFSNPPSPALLVDLNSLSNEDFEIAKINDFDYFLTVWNLQLDSREVVERVVSYIEQAYNLRVLRVADSFAQINN